MKPLLPILLSLIILVACNDDKEEVRMNNNGALIIIDFIDNYPGIFWISNWSKDEHYPNGFRYKIVSSVNKNTDSAILVVIIEESDGLKTEMTRMEADTSSLKKVGQVFVDGLADEYGLNFQEQDYTHVDTEEMFVIETTKNGWNSSDG